MIVANQDPSVTLLHPLPDGHPLVGQHGASRVVVIVEDLALVRNAITRLVQRRFIPRSCTSLEEGLRSLEELQESPAALILDVNLGSRHGDGIDIAQFAQDRFHGYIPTLILTGSQLVPELTERASQLRAEFLAKPQSSESVLTFLERVAVKQAWGVPDVLDLDRELQQFATHHNLTRHQVQLLFVLMRAAERAERATVNDNTRKACLRRILKRTGHSNFEQLRREIKQRAYHREHETCPTSSV